jgi:hypothetical protein
MKVGRELRGRLYRAFGSGEPCSLAGIYRARWLGGSSSVLVVVEYGPAADDLGSIKARRGVIPRFYPTEFLQKPHGAAIDDAWSGRRVALRASALGKL